MLLACRNGMAAGKAKGAGEGLLFRAYPGGADVSLSSTTGSYQPSLLYSTDEEKTWSPYTVGSAVHVNGGKSVSFKANGTNPTMGTDWGKWNVFMVNNGYASVEGHLSSLLGHDVLSAWGQFYAMFTDCSGLADASGLRFSMPTTRQEAHKTQALYCALFQNCGALTAVPKFDMPGGGYTPADCFNLAFDGCTALSDASGFGLGDEPWLSCGYASFMRMFRGCTSLTAAPVVQRKNAAAGETYSYMFYGCSKLAQLSVELTSWSGTGGWVDGVSTYGDFYCPTALGTNETI